MPKGTLSLNLNLSEDMRLTILGSGSNIHPTRAASGYLVRTDQTILLDFGPRTLANLLKTGVNRHRITHILFSHYHADHFSDFIRSEEHTSELQSPC